MSPQARTTVDAILSRVEKYGLSLVLLVMGIVWLMPKLDALFDDHRKFLEKTGQTMERQAATAETQAEIQAVGIRSLERIEDVSAETHGMMRDIHSQLIGKRKTQQNEIQIAK